MDQTMLYRVVLFAFTNVCFACGSSVDYRGSTYQLITERLRHSAARETCLELEMDLAVITDEDENTFIAGLMTSQPSAQDSWIGFYKTADDHDTLRWVDDTPFVLDDPGYFQPWWDDEPDSSISRGVRLRAANSEWADQMETFQYWAICEKKITHITINHGGTDLYNINNNNTPMTFTLIMTLRATSVTHCLLKCNLQTGCFVVKVIGSDDVTGHVQCDLYKADDGHVSVTISEFYINL